MTPLVVNMATFATQHVLDAVVLAAGAVIAVAWPRVVPFAALLGIGFQSSLTHTMSSDAELLVGLVAGLVIVRAQRRDWRLPVPGAVGWLLLALNVLVVVSLLVHLHTADAHAIVLGTEYFVSRSLLVAAVVLLAPAAAVPDWLASVGLLAVALGAARVLEAAGVPLRNWLGGAGIVLMGDYADIGSWNTFATLLAAGVGCLTAYALGPGISARRRWMMFGVAAFTAVAMASAQSRTVVGIFAVEAVVLLFYAREARLRVAVGLIVVAYAIGSLSPTFGIQHKPVLVSTEALPDNKVATAESPIQVPTGIVPTPGTPGPTPPPRRQLPAIQPDWRSVLDRNYYALEQTIPADVFARTGNRLVFIGRSGGRPSEVRLVVKFEGRVIARLKPTDISPYYHWVEVPIPDALVPHEGLATVSFQVTGDPDSLSDFFIVAGRNARAPGYEARIWSGTGWLTDDLSSDPGLQQGTLLVFANEQVPDMTPFTPIKTVVVDPSISDRLFLWQTALRIFEHNPIAGTGFYTFGLVKTEYQLPSRVFATYSNAHSNYFELLADLGPAGPLLFALLLLTPVLALLLRSRRRRLDKTEVAASVSLFAFAASSITQTWVADSRVYMTCWAVVLVAGIIVHQKQLAAPETSSRWEAAGGRGRLPGEAGLRT